MLILCGFHTAYLFTNLYFKKNHNEEYAFYGKAFGLRCQNG